MPRHLRAAISSLSAMPEGDPNQWYGWPPDPARTSLVEYFSGAAGWHLLGVELDRDLCEEIAGLAARRADLRPVLFHLIGFYPCAAFRRIFRRNVEQTGGGDFTGWLAVFPEMAESLRSAVVARAGRFNHAYDAVQACILWARHFDGGDAAWRQLACVVKREDRRLARRDVRNEHVRHDLETHGTVTLEEAARINHFLDELDWTYLDALGNAGWQAGYRSPPPDSWRGEAYRGRVLEHAVRGSRAFAGNAWCTDDVDLFAGIYARMSGVGRSSYRIQGHGPRDAGALREVVERARAATTT